MSNDLSEPAVAVVTGGGRGIGAAIARRLAATGHRVLITDRDETRARDTANRLGSRCEWAAHDVRDPGSHERIADAASALGSLRVWVNNAGVLIAGPAWSHGSDEIASTLEINVLGMMLGSRAATLAMADEGGRILNIASMAAHGPVPGLAVYAASKAAVLSFTTSLQGDLDRAGLPIRAHALCPDVVATDMVGSHASDAGAAILFAAARQLSAEQVAQAGVDLLSSSNPVRSLPRLNALAARATGLAPRLGLRLASAAQDAGERRQRRQVEEAR
ncbi:hypothetical protein GCM10009798_05180 [Nocardioides panacihumi]|uniref:SDR family oxidoreductase n=1 Tax=Nocardioides panacihumi TaxID=400774 RepID=A0ABN2QBC2_9ACTN